MIRYERSKSSMFLLEILINILLFSILCVCSLQFFIKSLNLTEDTTTLHHAVTACNNAAAIYESGDGTIEYIGTAYPYSIHTENQLIIYLDDNYEECQREAHSYSVLISSCDKDIPSVEITFHDADGENYYSIIAYCYQPLTPETVGNLVESEVPANE